MSSAEIAAFVLSANISNYLSTAANLVLLYEYVITFDNEISIIWKKQWTFPAILLLLVRWNMILQGVSEFSPINPVT
ncbi:hypothetical protein PHLGIDRAFT_486379 [Phlebiopsis gigantea 11061_1 CR5-6]|uniref:DUF6533 domain-containing protein n=1 Tax=Phlebiopsis gigantea (strain 11061_1 CR5-6) TaxID=745531 RepID=A0A0C3RW51_PHLG1|nr:hypothetical protein PHLGIDRAFT_486379 [Phlebiopsis gigantea 11061_1 CR5-6]